MPPYTLCVQCERVPVPSMGEICEECRQANALRRRKEDQRMREIMAELERKEPRKGERNRGQR